MALLQVLNVALGGLVFWVLAKVLAMSAPMPWRIVLALPLVLLLSCAALMLWQPPDWDAPPGALWRFGPSGIKLNPAHPTAQKLFRFWAVLGVCWLIAFDEAWRHDVSRLFGL